MIIDQPPEPPRAQVARCHTHRCWSRISRLRHRNFWRRRFHRFPRFEQAWAKCIASFETRGIPWPKKAGTNTGNGYFGSTQWLLSTALSAGFHPKPRHHPGAATVTSTSLHEQLVRTILWSHEAGRSQWSTSRYCG